MQASDEVGEESPIGEQPDVLPIIEDEPQLGEIRRRPHDIPTRSSRPSRPSGASRPSRPSSRPSGASRPSIPSRPSGPPSLSTSSPSS